MQTSRPARQCISVDLGPVPIVGFPSSSYMSGMKGGSSFSQSAFLGPPDTETS